MDSNGCVSLAPMVTAPQPRGGESRRESPGCPLRTRGAKLGAGRTWPMGSPVSGGPPSRNPVRQPLHRGDGHPVRLIASCPRRKLIGHACAGPAFAVSSRAASGGCFLSDIGGAQMSLLAVFANIFGNNIGRAQIGGGEVAGMTRPRGDLGCRAAVRWVKLPEKSRKFPVRREASGILSTTGHFSQQRGR